MRPFVILPYPTIWGRSRWFLRPVVTPSWGNPIDPQDSQSASNADSGHIGAHRGLWTCIPVLPICTAQPAVPFTLTTVVTTSDGH